MDKKFAAAHGVSKSVSPLDVLLASGICSPNNPWFQGQHEFESMILARDKRHFERVVSGEPITSEFKIENDMPLYHYLQNYVWAP